MTRIEEERIDEMLADAISERDRPIIGEGSLYDFHPSELVNALLELKELRAQGGVRVTDEMVKAGLEVWPKPWEEYKPGDVLRRAFTAALNVAPTKAPEFAESDWVIVPRELTYEMARAGAKGRQNSAISSFRDGWKFALAAAPNASLSRKHRICVKPLEWDEPSGHGVSPYYWTIAAKTPLNGYRIDWVGYGLNHTDHAGPFKLMDIGLYPTIEEAKAAAEADYRTRILSALETEAVGRTVTGWQPIETAPKDGTTVDLWHSEYGRYPAHFWGLPEHSCGEDGRYCDSDWHRMAEGWVDSAFNEIMLDAEDFTHWMPLPSSPALSSESKP